MRTVIALGLVGVGGVAMYVVITGQQLLLPSWLKTLLGSPVSGFQDALSATNSTGTGSTGTGSTGTGSTGTVVRPPGTGVQ